MLDRCYRTLFQQFILLGVCAFFLLLPPFACAQTPTFSDVRYGPYDRNELDVYLPPSVRNAKQVKSPVVIYFHGGGWVGGDKGDFEAEEFLENGIAVVSVNYRFTVGTRDAAPYPAPFNDAARAVQFVRTKSKSWKLDSNRIALMGVSAGAVMSMWIGYRDDMADPKSADPVLRQSTRVRCVVSLAGPTTLQHEWIRKYVGGPPHVHSAAYPLFGVYKVEQLETPKMRKVVREASPVEFVTSDDPPTYAGYESRLSDAPLPRTANQDESIHHARFGQLLKEKLDAVGVPCIFHYRGDREEMDLRDFFVKYLLESA